MHLDSENANIFENEASTIQNCKNSFKEIFALLIHRVKPKVPPFGMA
jgi:hypothetical protein